MTISTILIGLDGSEGSQRAASWTAELAAHLGASVVACHVYEPLDHLDLIRPGTDFAAVADLLHRDLAGTWTKPFHDAGVPVTARILEGLPTDALAAAAEQAGADLVVLGSVGRHRRFHHFGSTAMAMADATRIPVTIIRPDSGPEDPPGA